MTIVRHIAIGVAVSVALALLAPPADATPRQEAETHQRINTYRGPLTRHSGLDTDARNWSAWWAALAPDQFWHSPNIGSDTARHVPAGRWFCHNEIIARYNHATHGVPFVIWMWDQSQPHRAALRNLPGVGQHCPFGDWNRIGIGVVRHGDWSWVTVRLARW